MLEDEFGLVYHEINSLDVKFRPEHNKAWEQLRLKKCFGIKKLSQKSQKTGYSESYLIRIKPDL